MKQHLHSMDRNLMSLLVCIGELVIGVLLLLNPRGFTFAVFVALGVLLAPELTGFFADGSSDFVQMLRYWQFSSSGQ